MGISCSRDTGTTSIDVPYYGRQSRLSCSLSAKGFSKKTWITVGEGAMISLFLTLVFVFISGCAGVKHAAIPYEGIPADDGKNNSGRMEIESAKRRNIEADYRANGIRYYGSSLYILVNSDGRGNIQWRILELPDQTKKMVAQPYNFLATIKTDMGFSNGVLNQFKVAIDASVVPKALIETVSKVLPYLMAADAEYKVPSVEIYKIVASNNTFEFVGGHGDQPISVTTGKNGDTNEDKN